MRIIISYGGAKDCGEEFGAGNKKHHAFSPPQTHDQYHNPMRSQSSLELSRVYWIILSPCWFQYPMSALGLTSPQGAHVLISLSREVRTS